MSDLTLSDRLAIAALRARLAKSSVIGAVMRLPVLRWRYGLPLAEQLLIIPRDLRACDPSFAAEIAFGQFGLAGHIADLGRTSPFDALVPSLAWERELHGFTWLRHLRAAGTDIARDQAVTLVKDWILAARPRSKRHIAWEPGVLGRRVTSWISNGTMLLEGLEPRDYNAITDSLGAQLVELAARWQRADRAQSRLQALAALMLARLCVKDHDAQIQDTARALSDELKRQILPDGGHISRNPAVLIELLLDLLPLRQCFIARQLEVPTELHGAIKRIMSMLQFLRLGDGTLARFNGMGATKIDALVTVLAYDRQHLASADLAGQTQALPTSKGKEAGIKEAAAAAAIQKTGTPSGYERLQRSNTVIIMDVGGPPPLALAGQATAGCLSFELSSGLSPVVVNGGVPGPAHALTLGPARATTNHNTLSIDGLSSSKILPSMVLRQRCGGAPIRQPNRVTRSLKETHSDGEITLIASHDGYLSSHDMIHMRKLKLSGDGARLDGQDSIGNSKKTLRFAKDAPFAVHFHLHPEVNCQLASEEDLPTEAEVAGNDADAPPAAQTIQTIYLLLSNGETWLFSSPDTPLAIEDSTFYAEAMGPRRSLQIVLRAASFGKSQISWTLQRLGHAEQ